MLRFRYVVSFLFRFCFVFLVWDLLAQGWILNYVCYDVMFVEFYAMYIMCKDYH